MTTADDRHVQVAELLGAYVLHAVDPEEAQGVERHLAACPRCRAEVDRLREVAAAIGNSSEPPSAALWDRIASQLGAQASRGTPSEEGASPLVVDAGTQALAAVPGGARRRVPRWSPSGGRRARMAVGAGAAAACAVAAVIFGISWSNANARVGELQTSLAHQGTHAAVAAALASRGHKVVDLQGSAGTEAELVVRSDGEGYVVAFRLPALPPDETYQLWAEIGGRPISVGLLGSRPEEGVAFSLGPSSGARELMVTAEPTGGVVSPTSTPVAMGAPA